MSRLIVSFVGVSFVLAGSACEKAEQAPAVFLPADCVSEVRIDVRALRRSGLWAQIQENDALQGLFLRFHYYFAKLPIDELDSIHVASKEVGGRPREIAVYRGSAKIGLPADDAWSPYVGTHKRVRVGDHDSVEHSRGDETDDRVLHLSPEAGVLVSGDSEMLRKTLTGQDPSGGLVAGLRVFAGRSDAIVSAAWLVSDFLSWFMLPEEVITPNDRPKYLGMEIRKDVAEHHLDAVLKIRFEKGADSTLEKMRVAIVEMLRSQRDNLVTSAPSIDTNGGDLIVHMSIDPTKFQVVWTLGK